MIVVAESKTMLQVRATIYNGKLWFSKFSEVALTADKMSIDAATIPVELADRIAQGPPMPVARLLNKRLLANIARADRWVEISFHNIGLHTSDCSDRYEALRRVGFKVIQYGDIMETLYVDSGRH